MGLCQALVSNSPNKTKAPHFVVDRNRIGSVSSVGSEWPRSDTEYEYGYGDYHELSPDKKTNFKIDHKLRNERKRENKVKKLLLLGTPSSGASTIFNQIRSIHGYNINNNELQHIAFIRRKCVYGMLQLLRISQDLYTKNNAEHQDCCINVSEHDCKHKILYLVQFTDHTFMTDIADDNGSDNDNDSKQQSELQNIGETIRFLWNLSEIQRTFSKRYLFAFIENLDYFLNKIESIFRPLYEPTNEDILKSGASLNYSNAVMEETYLVKGTNMLVIDINGQLKYDYRKYLCYFEVCTAVIFVASLNHYASVSMTDASKNAMIESIEFFNEVTHSKWFRKTEFILFLNKDDLFRELIRNDIPLSICFNEQNTAQIYPKTDLVYSKKDVFENGIHEQKGNDEWFEFVYKDYLTFIQEQYKSNAQQYKHTRTFIHVISAIDTEAIKKTSWDCQNIVINSNLRNGGLV